MKKTIWLLCVPMLICMAFIYRESSLTENTSTQKLNKNTSQFFPAPQNNRFKFGSMDDYTDHDNNYRNSIIVYPNNNS